jgi:hypothetical protein
MDKDRERRIMPTSIGRCLCRCVLLICVACVFPAVMEAQGQSSAADSAARPDGECWEGRGAMLSVTGKDGSIIAGELLSVRDSSIILNTDTTRAPSAVPDSSHAIIALQMGDIATVKGGSGLYTYQYILYGCIVGAVLPMKTGGIGGETHAASLLLKLAVGGGAGALVALMAHNDDPPWSFTPGDDPAQLRQRARYRNGEPPYLRAMIP